MTTLILQVACNVPVVVSTSGVFDYLPPTHHEFSQPQDWLGRAVLVPFGAQTIVGLVVNYGAQMDLPAHKIKRIQAVVPFIPRADSLWLDFVCFIAQYYQRGLGEVALPALPTALRQAQSFLLDEASGEVSLRTGQAAWKKWQKTPNSPAALRLGDVLSLNSEQSCVLHDLQQAGNKPQLLFGVTGSGKTEVYLHYLTQILEADKQAQVLVLTPEINLTPQLAQRLENRFGVDAVVTLHSRLTESTRLLNFWRAASGQARVILGTRLAILAMLPHLKAIVVDEEHDMSYRQMEGVRYSARDLAIYRAHQLQIPVLLGSATPSLESWHNASIGRYGLHRLNMRAVVGAQLPQVQLIEVQRNVLTDGLSNAVRNAIERAMVARQTSMLFQNRRGYAPVLYCGHCGHVHDCPACSAHYVYHQTTRHLHCHHCGREARVPRTCIKCGNTDILPIGQGTQRLEEVVRQSWPRAVVRRIDADSTRKKGALEEALSDIAAGVVDIVIGTQMLAKGHDWAHLTTIGVLDVDSALFAQDYRAPERLFSQLHQVIGRAGRGVVGGRVFIQTEFVEHPIWQTLLNHDYESFARQELAVRRQLGLPPFAAYALLHVSAPKLSVALDFANVAREIALDIIVSQSEFSTITVNAAVPMNMVRVNRQERAQVLVECSSRARFQAFLPIWQAAILTTKSRLSWMIEVDPSEI